MNNLYKLVVLVVVILLLTSDCRQQPQQPSSEHYMNIEQWLNRRCTDGCVYRVRDKGVFVDSSCMSRCNDTWEYDKRSQQYVYLTPKQQNARYFRNLAGSVRDGAYVYQGGLLS